MDLGCIDMCCLENKPIEQNKATRDAAQPSVGSLNKFSSQIKKPPHRKGSPINWFPRKKVDSYLKRKIKLLQEVGGMNSTLDETLGDSNPHYSKVLKEKMAVREAAQKAMETRKAAMVEASWCRILQAARIHSKDAEALLLEAEKTASEAFEAAKAIGVIMYDIPDCAQKQYETETSLVNGGRLSTHNVTASFETAFEVDKQVGAALKTAFVKLASCPSINKEEFKELLRKISENPDTESVLELSSECESDTGAELETGLNCETVTAKFKPRSNKKNQVFEKFNMTKIVDLMLERLRHLHEDELASLATIVATCGLNAVLEAENLTDHHNTSSSSHHNRRVTSFGIFRSTKVEPELPSLDKFLVKHMTRLEREVQEARYARMKDNLDSTKDVKENSVSSVECVSDLGSVFVKHSSKLEKEIEEAKRTGINSYETSAKKLDKMQVTDVPLDKFLVRHMSKLEREVQEAKNGRNLESIDGNSNICASVARTQVQKGTLFCLDEEPVDKENIDLNQKMDEEVENKVGSIQQKSTGLKAVETESKKIEESQSLEEILVKPVHRLEKEKMQASSSRDDYVSQHYQNRRKNASIEEWESLDKVLVKHVSRLEKEKSVMGTEEPLVKVKRMEGNDGDGSLDQILVKHKSRLEIEKMAISEKPDYEAKHVMSRREVRERESQEAWGGISLGKNDGKGLDQILVKHKSRLEKEKVAFAEKTDDQAKHVMSRREVREKELQEAWGGLSLGNSIRPHLSRLQRDKAAWLKADEEEERRKDLEKGEVI